MGRTAIKTRSWLLIDGTLGAHASPRRTQSDFRVHCAHPQLLGISSVTSCERPAAEAAPEGRRTLWFDCQAALAQAAAAAVSTLKLDYATPRVRCA
jgi:hypothetical protein